MRMFWSSRDLITSGNRQHHWFFFKFLFVKSQIEILLLSKNIGLNPCDRSFHRIHLCHLLVTSEKLLIWHIHGDFHNILCHTVFKHRKQFIFFLLKACILLNSWPSIRKFSTRQKIKFPFSLPPTVSLFFQLTRNCIWTKSAHKTIGHVRSQRLTQMQINYFIVAARRKKSARATLGARCV